jgi:hypothetical protein
LSGRQSNQVASIAARSPSLWIDAEKEWFFSLDESLCFEAYTYFFAV